VFECQLMPNIIYVLKSSQDSSSNSTSDAERRNELARVLLRQGSGKVVDEKTGMEWGTCLVFSCRDDCRIETGSTRNQAKNECWREEFVLVQWE